MVDEKGEKGENDREVRVLRDEDGDDDDGSWRGRRLDGFMQGG